MVAPIVAAIAIPLLKDLAESGLGLLSSAIKAKGKQVIEDKLGVDIEKSMQTEEGRYKLLQLQTDHEQFLLSHSIETEKLDIERERMRLGDVDSARKMQIAALQQDDRFSKRFIYIFASIWSLFAMGYIMMITFATIDEKNIRFADTILGFLLGTVVATILQFFFGSSKSSKDKDEAMKQIADRMQDERR
jgi:hypothetical protein